MQCKWTLTNGFILSTLQGNAHVTVPITKNASLAAIARYISIMTIYTVGYLQVFQRRAFLFQVWIAMICKERSIALPWFLTKTQLMTLFYLACRATLS